MRLTGGDQRFEGCEAVPKVRVLHSKVGLVDHKPRELLGQVETRGIVCELLPLCVFRGNVNDRGMRRTG